MKNLLPGLLILLTGILYLVSCADPVKDELEKPSLLIKIRDDSGKIIPGATVTLYKSRPDSGLTKVSDSTGLVIFTDLDIELYYWLAQKGCMTNRISQMTLNRKLVPGGAHYGYSVLAENGALKIINNSPGPYKVSDSLFNITVVKDSPYLVYRRVRSYKIYSEQIATPGVGKDTVIRIKCGDTAIINLPY